MVEVRDIDMKALVADSIFERFDQLNRDNSLLREAVEKIAANYDGSIISWPALAQQLHDIAKTCLSEISKPDAAN